MKTKNYILILLLVFLSNSLFAQAKKEEVISKHKNGSPSFIKLKETNVSFNKTTTESFLKKQFNLNDNISFQTKKEDVDLGITIQKQQQYYKGIKVEFGEVVLAGKNNALNHVSGNVLRIENLNTKPTLTKESALNIALQKIGSQEYAWQNLEMENFRKQLKDNPNATYYPKSELVIVDKNLLDSIPKPVLAYKMDIYSTNPLKYNYYYIDAKNGEIIFENPIINHIEGIAATRYSGTRTIETEAVGSSFKLKDNTRGSGIITYNLNHSWSYSSPTNFTDNDNNWTITEYDNTNKDNAALDAHWGAEMTYDYFLDNFNRNSYDNNGSVITGYVHYGTNYPGAFWNGVDKIMTYGDGSYPRDAIVSLDAVGHEIAHGITNHEIGTNNNSGMWSFYESGAIEESISDIWGAMVEYYVAPEKNTYSIGEDFYLNGKVLRSMDNPKTIHSYKRQPDTYLGEFYHPDSDSEDNGGVHTNSGIMNHWFYLLAEGGNGMNDNGDTYFLSGIGKEDAAKIVYRAVKYYFNSTTTFYQARELTMQAAADLFGEATTIKVANAWYAVGVGNFIPYGSHYISGPTQITPGTGGMYTLNPYVGATHYQWVIPTGCTNTYYCWEIVQGQGTNTALIHGGDIGRHNIICKIYSNDHLMASQSISVNVQNPYNGGGSGSDPCGDLGNFNGLIYPPEPCDDGNGIAATESYFSKFVVYDMSGRRVLTLNYVDSVDLNNLANGLYIIKARLNTNKVITKKILK
ncbi:M4 family metallopeptidase [Lacinutrix gracilariae]|uniref:M4 family metallopeptidase n=1 Tax=Lacinutrix gracilariae TaxID=1747198 RepID=A0ABW5K7R2_9FLAO